MKKNTSKTDRIMRLVMAASFVLFIVTGIAHYPQVYFFEVLIVILTITAVAGYCPLWALFGINTITMENSGKDNAEK